MHLFNVVRSQGSFSVLLFSFAGVSPEGAYNAFLYSTIALAVIVAAISLVCLLLLLLLLRRRPSKSLYFYIIFRALLYFYHCKSQFS